MSFGLTSGVTVNRQYLKNGRIVRFTERADASRVTRVSHAIGLVRANASEVKVFKNCNFNTPITIVEPVSDNDIIDVIDRNILVNQCSTVLSIDNLLGTVNRTKALIEEYEERLACGEDLQADITCLYKILEDQEAELLQARIDCGQLSDDPAILALIGFEAEGVVQEEEEVVTDITGQTIFVSWDAQDTFVNYQGGPGTGPTDTETIDITITTDDGEPTEEEVQVTIVVDDGTMVEGDEYQTTNFIMVIPVGTASGYMYTAQWDANDGTSPDDATLTLTAVGATPIGDTSVLWQAVV